MKLISSFHRLDKDLETLRASVEILRMEIGKSEDEFDTSRARNKINGIRLWLDELLDRAEEVREAIERDNIRRIEKKI